MEDGIIFFEDPSPQDFPCVLSQAIPMLFLEADVVLIEMEHLPVQMLKYGKSYTRLCIFAAA